MLAVGDCGGRAEFERQSFGRGRIVVDVAEGARRVRPIAPMDMPPKRLFDPAVVCRQQVQEEVEVGKLAGLGHATFSSFCSERRNLGGCGVSGWVLRQWV